MCIHTLVYKKNVLNYNNYNDYLHPGYAPHYHYIPSETLSELSEILSVRILILTLFQTMRLYVKSTHLLSQTNYRLTLTKSLSLQSLE